MILPNSFQIYSIRLNFVLKSLLDVHHKMTTWLEALTHIFQLNLHFTLFVFAKPYNTFLKHRLLNVVMACQLCVDNSNMCTTIHLRELNTIHVYCVNDIKST
jgi:hypothetical protein